MSAESLAASTGLTAESCDWATHEIAVAIGVLPESHERQQPAAFASAQPMTDPLGIGAHDPSAASPSDATVVAPVPQLTVQPAAPPPPPPPPPLSIKAAGSRKSARIWV